MAEITDPQVVTFCNDRVRPLGDLGWSFWRKCKDVLQDYNSGDIGTKINGAGAGNFVGDASLTDGRTRLTGGDVFNLMTLAQAAINFFEGTADVPTLDRKDVIDKPHTNRVGN